jgi:hypothetical protein
MRSRRERLYDCSYGPTGSEAHLVFRAWTPVEAASGVEEAMARAGIPLVGSITVRDSRGRVVLQVPVHPSHAAGISGAA